MTIAVLLDNPYINDRRVSREINTFVNLDYKVCLFCFKAEYLPDYEEHRNLSVFRIFSSDIYDIKQQQHLKRYFPQILNVKPQVLHCHDQNMLHLGAQLKRINPALVLIYDSHELFHAWPLNLSSINDPIIYIKSLIVRKYQIVREKRNSKSIDWLITVNKSLADNLKKHFILKNEPIIIRNIPQKQEFTANRNLIREKFSLPLSTRILVFIGSAIYRKTLNLEQVIIETADIQDFALVIICGEQGGKNDMMKWVSDNSFTHVFFHTLLAPDEIGPVLASCDVGLVPTWNKKDLSYWFALDNKLFEYIMSGIPVLATQQPEYIAIVEKYDVGICVNPDKQGDYKRGLMEILERPQQFANPLRLARENLDWEIEKEELIQLYTKINAE